MNCFRKSNQINLLLLITIGVNVMIPKAGIKIHGIPITVGSILILLMIIRHFYSRLTKTAFEVSDDIVPVAICIVFWTFVLIGNWVLYTGDYHILSIVKNTIPYIASISIYGLFFFVVIDEIKSENAFQLILQIIKICIYFTMGYAIIQYFFGVTQVAIPGITVNLTDYLNNPDNWWFFKSNAFEDGHNKIMSTYQNGNLYGANLMLLFPVVFDSCMEKEWERYLSISIFAFISIITQSRIVIIGFVFYFFLLLLEMCTIKKQRPRNLFAIFIFSASVICVISLILSRNIEFIKRITDSLNWKVLLNAHDRTGLFLEYLKWLKSSGTITNFLFGSFGLKFDGQAYEMLFASLFVYGGLFGLVVFCAPLLRILSKQLEMRNEPYSIGILNGLLVYSFVAMIDGAFWLPPTAVNYWMVLGLGSWLGIGLVRINH